MSKHKTQKVDVNKILKVNKDNLMYSEEMTEKELKAEYRNEGALHYEDEILYCMVDGTRCDGLCRKNKTNSVGAVCCGEVCRKSEC